MKTAIVSGGFDDLCLSHLCLLHKAAGMGTLHVLLWSDEAVLRLTGKPPKFPESERRYLLESIRHVDRVTVISELPERDTLPCQWISPGTAWAVEVAEHSVEKQAFCQAHGLEYYRFTTEDLAACLDEPLELPASPPGKKRVLVTGCFDWLHSGHVRFFEEVAELGDLYVVVGHDDNIRLLKGERHPMFPENQRRYMVEAVRFVKQALVSSGHGWLDAEPEIERLKPHIYAVNEDGDRPEKRAYCESHGIEYRVLRRLPKQGLPRRQSTDLRASLHHKADGGPSDNTL